MSNNYTIDIEKAKVSVGAIETIKSTVSTEFKNLQAIMDETIGSPVWSGERADNFLKSWNIFAYEFESCLKDLEDLRTRLDAANAAYLAFEQQN